MTGPARGAGAGATDRRVLRRRELLLSVGAAGGVGAAFRFRTWVALRSSIPPDPLLASNPSRGTGARN